LERQRYRRAGPPQRPILLVCGSARSGTTLAAQVLVRNLRLSHLNNLMALFPRAPLTAAARFGGLVRPVTNHYVSFYGRTQGWAGHSDSLNLWDRWLGSDRTAVPDQISPAAQRSMAAFFGALEGETNRPVLCKNNALDASAHLVAEALPTARFVCILRSRESLAFSLLNARLEIHGTAEKPYGLAQDANRRSRDPVEDVCRQVLYHEELADMQQKRLGPERFLRVQFEDICNDPRRFVMRISQEVLGEPADMSSMDPALVPFTTSRRTQGEDLKARIRAAFERLDETL
jgi:hypothetical protein